MEQFELFMGCLGNGTTLCNKLELDENTRDYRVIGHISQCGRIQLYVPTASIPSDALNQIKRVAQKDRDSFQAIRSSMSYEARYSQILMEIDTKTFLYMISRKEWKMEERVAYCEGCVYGILEDEYIAMQDKFHSNPELCEELQEIMHNTLKTDLF